MDMIKKLTISRLLLAALLLGLSVAGPALAGDSATETKPPQPNKNLDAQGSDLVEADVPPVLLSMPRPVYPEEARSKQLEGTVQVRGVVSIEGKVVKAEVAQSVHPILDQAAITAFEGAVFKPARLKGKPVAVWVAMPVRFVLDSKKK
jgi:periplasmic protein TonB